MLNVGFGQTLRSEPALALSAHIPGSGRIGRLAAETKGAWPGSGKLCPGRGVDAGNERNVKAKVQQFVRQPCDDSLRAAV